MSDAVASTAALLAGLAALAAAAEGKARNHTLAARYVALAGTLALIALVAFTAGRL